MSDILLAPSGIGTQSKLLIDGLSKTGRFEFIQCGGAIKHHSYQPIQYNECTKIYPVDGYGSKEIVRSLIRTERPDIVLFFTDPRFWIFLFEIENEVRHFAPMVFFGIWDAGPKPSFNRKYWSSCDAFFAISKLTHRLVTEVCPELENHWVGHSVDTEIFKRYPEQEISDFRRQVIPKDPNNEKFVIFWNSRNARRKLSGSLVWWYADFLDIVGKDKAVLVLNTDPRDPNGQPLVELMEERGLTNGEVIISNQKVDAKVIALFNNIADIGINISDAEGWGLSVMEALACETPVIGNMIGGIVDQLQDPDTNEIYGIGLEPVSRAIIGSQDVGYIEESRVSKDQVVNALIEMYNTPKEKRREIGQRARKHILKNLNFSSYIDKFDKLLTKIHEERGSWETRTKYKSWEMKEL